MTASRACVLAGALAAMIGGLLWVVKAVAIILTTVEPPIIFDVAALFFPIAVMGLYAVLDVPRPRLAVAGLVVACCAELAAVVSILGGFLGPPEWSPTGSTTAVLTPFIALTALGTFLSLLLVGIVVRRTRSLLGVVGVLPLILAVSAVPLIAFGAVLQMINSRLFNLPTLLIGGAWIALGTLMARGRYATVRVAAPF